MRPFLSVLEPCKRRAVEEKHTTLHQQEPPTSGHSFKGVFSQMTLSQSQSARPDEAMSARRILPSQQTKPFHEGEGNLPAGEAGQKRMKPCRIGTFLQGRGEAELRADDWPGGCGGRTPVWSVVVPSEVSHQVLIAKKLS